MSTIKRIMIDNPPPLNKSPFRYELSDEAAAHNSSILERFNFDLTRVIAAHPNTEIAYGSEFRQVQVLEPLLHRHPYWPYLKSSLQKGLRFKFKKLAEKDRLADLEQALEFGNHKSTQEFVLTKIYSKFENANQETKLNV